MHICWNAKSSVAEPKCELRHRLQKFCKLPVPFISSKFLIVFGKQKGAGAVIRNFGSDFGMQFNLESSALGSVTLVKRIPYDSLKQNVCQRWTTGDLCKKRRKNHPNPTNRKVPDATGKTATQRMKYANYYSLKLGVRNGRLEIWSIFIIYYFGENNNIPGRPLYQPTRSRCYSRGS